MLSYDIVKKSGVFAMKGIEMNVKGVVLSKDRDRILVAKNIDRETYLALDHTKGSYLDQSLNLTYYRFDDIERLEPGDIVEIKTNGIEAMSYPGQATALRIIKKRVKKQTSI